MNHVWAVAVSPATLTGPAEGTTVVRLFSGEQAATEFLQKYALNRPYHQLYRVERMSVQS